MRRKGLISTRTCAQAQPSKLHLQKRNQCSMVEEAEAIAKDAFVFFYPMVENYKTLWYQAVDDDSVRYRGPFNRFSHARDLIGPSFDTVVTPNNDTLYSLAWLDLRAEPLVLSLPSIPRDRYYSMQLVDAYTHNFAILSSRTVGNNGGAYLIVGPNWNEQVPTGIFCKTICSESEYVALLGRTEVRSKEDIKNVAVIQSNFKLTTLSQFTGNNPPEVKSWPSFVSVDVPNLLEVEFFFSCVNFIMRFTKVHDTEADKFESFSKIGVSPGARFPAVEMDKKVIEAIQKGLLEGKNTLNMALKFAQSRQTNGWRVAVDPAPFGDRDSMQGRYLIRAAAAMVGLYGLDPQEAFYPSSTTDVSGSPYNGNLYCYTVTFASCDLPQVHGFWSLSMYNEKRCFVDNPINRYSIGDRTPGLQYTSDGSLTVYIQRDSPGQEKESNWLPAPNGLFSLVMRLYWPCQEALDGPYIPPTVVRTETNLYSKV